MSSGRKKLAIPLFGKMATRTFHSAHFGKVLEEHKLCPLYFIGPHYFGAANLDRTRYFDLKSDVYEEILRRQVLLRGLAQLRRFVVRTETTDLRFRDSIEDLLFNEGPVAQVWGYAALMDVVRRMPGMGPFAVWLENSLFHEHVHDDVLKKQEVACVLTPGAGNFGFWNEGLFAREAKRSGLFVVAAITNYDNILNMGYRGFMPDYLAVWSKLMADDAMRLQHIPASRIEVTGPIQYDRYFAPLPISREEFLCSKGLDPARKTILYAGGVNITRYFEFYSLFVAPEKVGRRSPYNLVIRPYPHVKLLSSPGWKILEKLFARAEGVFMSNSLTESSDNLAEAELRRDLETTPGIDDLYCWLKYSDVLINYFSTISLEAAICDLPTIHVGYDSYQFGHRYDLTEGFHQRQTHNRRKLRLAAAKIAKDESELIKLLDQYLGDKTIDCENRHEYALSECEHMDGQSTTRLAGLIATRLGKN